MNFAPQGDAVPIERHFWFRYSPARLLSYVPLAAHVPIELCTYVLSLVLLLCCQQLMQSLAFLSCFKTWAPR